jgi:hypothetical protein
MVEVKKKRKRKVKAKPNQVISQKVIVNIGKGLWNQTTNGHTE